MSDDNSLPLSREESRQLAEQLAVLAKAGLPLASGLRAAAEEMPSPRLAAAMSAVAERLEAGRSLDDVLRGSPRLMPEHMLRLIETGIRSGNLAEVLTHLVDIDRSSFDLRRSVRAAIAYPLLLMVLCSMLIIFMAIHVLPDLRDLTNDFYSDFNGSLPLSTQILYWFSGDKVLRFLGMSGAALTMLIIGLRVSLPPQRWRWLLTRIPLIGPMLLWRGIENWARLVSLLLMQGLPAPEALRLAATGVNDALMAVEGLRLSRTTINGRSISDALGIIGKLPSSIVPTIRWGEEHNALPEAFDTVADMFENRLRLRASLLQSTLPPLAFIFIALLALWMVNAMFMPAAQLIQFFMTFSFKGRPPPPDWVVFLSENAQYFVAGFFAGLGAMIVILPALRLVFAPATRAFDGWLIRYIKGVKSTFLATSRLLLESGFYVTMLGGMILLCGYAGPVIWLAMMVVILMAHLRYAEMERRSLMWFIAVAVQKGMPLAKAASAFAEERRDKLGRQASKLASRLSKGASLDEALAAAKIRLPTDTLLGVRMGQAINSVNLLVDSTQRRSNMFDGMAQRVAAKFAYLSVFAIFCAAAIAFIQMRIVPAFVKILEDFALRQPPSFGILFGTVLPFSFGPGALAALLAMFLLIVALAFVAARYCGLLHWDPPLVRELTMPLDEALVLRALAEAVERNTPMYAVVAALARKYPKDYVRNRLHTASYHMSNGVDWCESLHLSGLLPRCEGDVLRAAERVGNLGWAMKDMAERLSRRFLLRANGIMAVGFPLVLIVFAIIVFLVAFGLIEPLTDLIVNQLA